MCKDSIFFAVLALMFVVVGSAASSVIFDFLSIVTIILAWVVYESEEE